MRQILLVFLIFCSFIYGETNKYMNDIILEAMGDELDRSIKKLQIKDMQRPYYLEYLILDIDQLVINASFGSLVKSQREHNRLLKVGIRVGDYLFDNSGFLGKSSMFSTIGAYPQNIAIENDYDAIRRDIWMATDKAYKYALGQLAQKKAFIKNQIQLEQIADFSKEKKAILIAPTKRMNVDKKKWEKIIKNLSGIFRKFPYIYESYVQMEIKIINKYFINNEGTMFRQTECLVYLVAYASTQSKDGMILTHHIPFYANIIDELPEKNILQSSISKMAEELSALTSAPITEKYTGPVLFTGQASAEIFAQLLVSHLSGYRPPLSEIPQMSKMIFSSKLAHRLNRRVLPSFFTVIDNPKKTRFANKPLLGSYNIDDQGVISQTVKLIEKGILKTLLMSRRPRKEILISNGHARASIFGNAGVQIGNLFIYNENGKKYSELKKELLALCKEEGLTYGLLIKSFDNPAITGTDLSMSPMFFGSNQSAGEQMSVPVMVYKVYVEDEREELVRGISLSEISLRSLRDIVAAGEDYYLHHRLLMPGGGIINRIFAFSGGRTETLGVKSSIIVPSVLFKELEFRKTSTIQKKPPLLIHPFFDK